MASCEHRAILVVGMGRSGTSFITRGLKALGVELGDELLPASPDNPTGYWEDAALQALNDRVLLSLGRTWSTIAPVPDGRWNLPELKTHMLEAIEITRERFGKFALWGFKDPRTTRLLPFWQPILDRLAIADSYVIAVRNPLSVARSLKARENFDPEKSYYLWLAYVVDAYARTGGRMRVVVDYDEVMARPVEQLRRMAERLGLPIDSAVEEQIQWYATEFLDPNLRHSVLEPADVYLDNQASELIAKTYEVFKRVALERLDLESDDVREVVARGKSALEAFAPLVSYTERLLAGCQGLRVSLGRVEAERESLRAELAHLAEVRAAHDAERDAKLDEWSTELQSARRQLEDQTTQLALAQTRNSELTQRARLTQIQLEEVWRSPGWGIIQNYRCWVDKRRRTHPRSFAAYERLVLWLLRRSSGSVQKTDQTNSANIASDGEHSHAVTIHPAIAARERRRARP